MNSKLYFTLSDSYKAVYDENLRDSLYEQYEFIDELSDNDLTDVVEEVIGNLLEEGYEFEEIQDILKEELIGEILFEARVTSDAGRAGGGTKVTTGQGSRMAAKDRLAKRTAEKRAERVARVKSAVKSGVAKAKEAGREAKFKAVDKKVAAYANKRNLHPAAGMAARSKDPAKRRGLRSKVAKDIASRASAKAKEVKGRATQKAASAAVSGYAAGRAAKQAVGDAAGRAKQSAKNMAARAGRAVSDAKAKAKSGVKGLIRKAAEKVASGASKVAKRMSEEYDQYDLVLEFLQAEGIAQSLEEAKTIMIKELDREDIETITSLYN